MEENIQEVLKRMGWISGFHLPIANDENKVLQAKVEELMFQKARATISYESAKDRCVSIQKHLKFVKHQNEENQNLLGVYKQQIDLENHNVRISKSERDSYQREIREIDKVMQDTQERNERKRIDLNKVIEKVEKLKCEATWDTEALAAWEDSLKTRNEDNETLKKYSKEDEKKNKDLEIKRQNLSIELVNRKESIRKMVAEIKKYEQILERTGKQLQQQKEEKAALVNQRQQAMKNLANRDEAIIRANQDIHKAQELLAEVREKLDEQNDFYNNQINDNKQLGMKINAANNVGSKLRKQLNDLTQYVLTLHSEANTLKRTLIATAHHLEKERAATKNLNNEMVNKDLQISTLKMEIGKLTADLEEIQNSTMTVAERTRKLEGIIENEKRLSKMLDQDCERLSGLIFRTQQQLKELKDTMKIKELEISGCETSIISLRKITQGIFNNVEKQKEIIYNTDYKLNCLEEKLAMLEGETSDEDKQLLEEKIHELEVILTEQNEIKVMIQGQITRIEDEMRRIQTAMLRDNSQLETLRDKLQSQMMILEVGTRQTAFARQTCQEKQVEENILQLRVNKIEQVTKHEQDAIFNLQNFRLDMETAMKERKLEINVEKEILSVKRRNLNEEKGRLKGDISNRSTKIQQLQQKYHIATMALGKDENGEPLSVTHFKIKNAQEKYMLQEEGDKLDSQIRRTEKEIVAMENTLKVVNHANVEYRHNLEAVDDGEEASEMESLEKLMNSKKSLLRTAQKELLNRKQQWEDLKRRHQEYQAEEEEARKSLETVQEDYMRLQQYILEQWQKLDRVDKHLATVNSKLQNRNMGKYQNNLLIRHLQDANKGALQQLGQLPQRHEDMKERIQLYINEYDLDLPGPKTSFGSSSGSSYSLGSSSYSLNLPSVSQVTLTFDPAAEIGNRRLANKKRCSSKTKF